MPRRAPSSTLATPAPKRSLRSSGSVPIPNRNSFMRPRPRRSPYDKPADPKQQLIAFPRKFSTRRRPQRQMGKAGLITLPSSPPSPPPSSPHHPHLTTLTSPPSPHHPHLITPLPPTVLLLRPLLIASIHIHNNPMGDMSIELGDDEEIIVAGSSNSIVIPGCVITPGAVGSTFVQGTGSANVGQGQRRGCTFERCGSGITKNNLHTKTATEKRHFRRTHVNKGFVKTCQRTKARFLFLRNPLRSMYYECVCGTAVLAKNSMESHFARCAGVVRVVTAYQGNYVRVLREDEIVEDVSLDSTKMPVPSEHPRWTRDKIRGKKHVLLPNFVSVRPSWIRRLHIFVRAIGLATDPYKPTK
ncbi:MAG: hypothetical protein J3Q66DRAFT_368349 [Benniella sp.]|nr:MAG: hypothetical protein J3Q66DRAFT_376275 [Benniella sp.]KAK3820363.1 MAG: hypothetical protein J3Q66DRAFT_368346 [Benniella sp.]KAK3820366.1 MAG: hypothetical protein J3Q66DRAFT_368349 [Benniella sp.]